MHIIKIINKLVNTCKVYGHWWTVSAKGCCVTYCKSQSKQFSKM